MSDTDKRRDVIDRVARDWQDTVRQSGNTSYTYEQARQRVADAVTRGDAKRDNNNR